MASSATIRLAGAPLPRRWAEVPLRTSRVRLLTAVPHPALADDVEQLWWLEALEPLPGPAIRRCASKASVDVVLALDGHFCERAEARLLGTGRRVPYVIGPTTASAEVVTTGRCVAVGARIRPGRAATLLGVGAGELRDRVARLEDVVEPARRCTVGEGEPPGPLAAVDRLEEVFLALRRHAGAQDPLVAEAVRLVERRRGAVTVKELARWLGSTPRQLERRFREQVGLSPKRWCRIARLDRAMALLASATRPPLVEVAGAAGYHDQAHLTREFRDLAGTTPGGFVRAQVACD